mmetsp:Transcript_29827/g.27311  ORF Transcript_29827/g.27311 Transcript_29827/m.27311 type:complete len:123 (+) Transcript_29827:61-429(+)
MATTSFKFYHNIGCPFCRPTYYLIKHFKLPHEEYQVNLSTGEQNQEAFLKINPFGKVPTITDGDFITFESNTVIRYIANQYNKDIPEYFYPQDAKARSHVDLYFDWAASNMISVLKFTVFKL